MNPMQELLTHARDAYQFVPNSFTFDVLNAAYRIKASVGSILEPDLRMPRNDED